MRTPATGLYRAVGSSGVPWVTEPGGKIPNNEYIDWCATHEYVIDGPQAFSINDRWFLWDELRGKNPETRRIAHVECSIHNATPDTTTFFGRYASAIPYEKHAKNAAGAPTDFVDLIHDGPALADFLLHEILGPCFKDGSRVFTGVLVDMCLSTPWPNLMGGVEWKGNGAPSQRAFFDGWRAAFFQFCDRFVRRVPAGFELYINPPFDIPPSWWGGLWEGWPDQNGGFQRVLGLHIQDQCPRPLLFAASNGMGAPTSEPFRRRYHHVLAGAAILDGVAFMQPGEPEDGSGWDKPGPWRELPVYDLGRPKGKPWSEGTAWRRRFEHGEALVLPALQEGFIIGGRPS